MSDSAAPALADNFLAVPMAVRGLISYWLRVR